MIDTKYSIAAILIMAGVTFLLRFIPFIVFSGKKETPQFIVFLGKYLPYAIIGMLLVYCFKDVSFLQGTRGIPEIIAIAVVGVLHWWKNNTLLSVIVGTALYMVLVQFVFV